jgi:hypothetical protein
MMPLTYKIDHQERFVTSKTQGRVVVKDVEDYFDALMVQDAMSYPKLMDATEVEFVVTDDEMMALGARVSAYTAVDPRGPICLVAVSPEAIDMLRRFTNLGGAKRPAKIVATVDEGRQWLREQVGTQG